MESFGAHETSIRVARDGCLQKLQLFKRSQSFLLFRSFRFLSLFIFILFYLFFIFGISTPSSTVLRTLSLLMNIHIVSVRLHDYNGP